MPKILLIDDNPDIQKLLCAILYKYIAQADIILARSGTEGIRNAEQILPDTILLDIKMNDMDGFEVCRRLKTDKRTKHIPIIMLTGIMTDSKSRIKGLDIGADAFLTKPVQAADLIAQVNVMLRIKNADDRLRNEKEKLKISVLESEEKYRLMFERMISGFAIIKMIYDDANNPVDFRYLDVNPAHEIHTGMKDIVGKTGKEVMPWLKHTWIENFAHVDQAGVPIEMEDYIDETKTWFKLFAYRPKKGLVAVTIENITEKKHALNELVNSREQLRNLSLHLQSVREDERTIIARELHDELGQTLTALKFDVSWLNKMLPRNLTSAIEKTESMLTIVDTTIQLTKKIICELRPGLLDDLGLTAAIEWQAKEFEKHTGIICDFTCGVQDIELDKNLATALFRIFQETLTNTARHAHATHIDIHLFKHDNHLSLFVGDNGNGITDERISNPKSFGLIGIRERVLQFGGSFNIHGVEGKGTTVTVTVPIH